MKNKEYNRQEKMIYFLPVVFNKVFIMDVLNPAALLGPLSGEVSVGVGGDSELEAQLPS